MQYLMPVYDKRNPYNYYGYAYPGPYTFPTYPYWWPMNSTATRICQPTEMILDDEEDLTDGITDGIKREKFD